VPGEILSVAAKNGKEIIRQGLNLVGLRDVVDFEPVREVEVPLIGEIKGIDSKFDRQLRLVFFGPYRDPPR